jgi:hypothetical protein
MEFMDDPSRRLTVIPSIDAIDSVLIGDRIEFILHVPIGYVSLGLFTHSLDSRSLVAHVPRRLSSMHK